jgi:hypothetical protein
MQQTIYTLAKLCGYSHGWCRLTNLSRGECPEAAVVYSAFSKRYETVCSYFSKVHPSFPMITKDKDGNMVVPDTMRYDTRYQARQPYDEVENGVIKTDEMGHCDTCHMETYYYDVNVKVFICSNPCRRQLYKKLEANYNG